jgi:YceI-like domain
MKKLLVPFFIAGACSAFGQKYTSEKSFVSFFSSATIENITAENTKSTSLFNTTSGEIAFSIPIHDFEFAKSLMKEHFNEKYMDTEKIPNATFSGTVKGYQPTAPGAQAATASGKLSIHGVTKDIEVPGTVEFEKDKIIVKSTFIVKLEDYKIPRPQLLWQNIAEQVEVKIEFTYKPL